jgi:hypothetical protein
MTMAKTGKKSAAELEIAAFKAATCPPEPPPTSPEILTSDEQVLFRQLRVANPHITESDVPLLIAYIQAISMTHRLGRGDDVLNWERAARATMALATKLKLTPQADRRHVRGGQGVTWQQLAEMNGEPARPWEGGDEDEAQDADE